MKVSEEARKQYSDRIKQYQAEIKRLGEIENRLRKELSGDAATHPTRLRLAADNVDMVSYYVLMHELSVALLGVKNESYLNEGRKRCYKAIIYVEEAVSNLVDAPFSEYEDGVLGLETVSDGARYSFVRKLGFTLDAIQDGFGANSKWKWSFVELLGRYAVITKNLLNLRTFVAQLDPRVEGYDERTGHLSLCKELLQSAADRYREKYELSTHRLDDMKLAISYLAALKRLYALLGEDEGSDVVAKKIDVWKTKMEADERKTKEQARRR